MNAMPTQDTRIGELRTPLGKDKLVLLRLDVSEGLSELFEIRVDCASEDPILDLGPLIGNEASVSINTIGGKTRHFSGIVVEAGLVGAEEQMFAYRLTLRPWTWLLRHASNSRIFQKASTKDIIKEVFDKAGFGGQYDLSGLTESYSKRDYCVQYSESHLDFILRLMEEVGIYFYFKHEPGKHTMVLVDASSVHKPVADLPEVEILPMGERTRDDREFLRAWNFARSFHTGKVVVKAYDFVSPDAEMKQEKSQSGGYKKDDFEIFQYPHKYKEGETDDVGDKVARATLQSHQTRDQRRYAEGNAPSLFPGGTVKLRGSKLSGENQEYLVVGARHTLVTQMYRSGNGGDDGEAYDGQYILQPKARQFRAPQVTPRPIVYGPQTALVVGPKGSEIHTDKYGRVKLQFHWDREGKKDDKSSRWVRVAHPWSGKEWGAFYIPRVGMEAVVEFIDGDPDRPLVIGTVYNAKNMPPVELPANKTQRGIKTRSSEGGGSDHYNELIFEDKKNDEFVRFHAEKDFLATVEDMERRTIKGKKRSGPGDAARATRIEKGDDTLAVENGDRKVTISRDHTMSIDRNQSIKVGREVLIEAGSKIVLKVGGSKITMTPGEIKIQTSKLTTDAPMTEITAAMLLDAKGGIIKLNS